MLIRQLHVLPGLLIVDCSRFHISFSALTARLMHVVRYDKFGNWILLSLSPEPSDLKNNWMGLKSPKQEHVRLRDHYPIWPSFQCPNKVFLQPFDLPPDLWGCRATGWLNAPHRLPPPTHMTTGMYFFMIAYRHPVSPDDPAFLGDLSLTHPVT